MSFVIKIVFLQNNEYNEEMGSKRPVCTFCNCWHYCNDNTIWCMLLLLPHNLAYTIGYIVSFLVNYLLTTSFTFKAVRSLYSGIGFGVCHVINYLMHIGLLNFFIFMGLPKAVAPIPVLCICVPTNFFLVKFVMVKFIRR